MKVMDRNKFFSLLGIGMLGALFSKILPINLASSTKTKAKNVKVTINPLAVKRQKINNKNV